MPSSSPKVRLFTIKTAQLLMTILFLFLIYVLSRQAAALAPGRYHSKAALALQEVLLKVLSED